MFIVRQFDIFILWDNHGQERKTKVLEGWKVKSYNLCLNFKKLSAQIDVLWVYKVLQVPRKMFSQKSPNIGMLKIV